MKRNRFTQEQIIGVLREQETGSAVAEFCRKHRMSPATFYARKTKYGGIDVSDAKRFRAIEDECSATIWVICRIVSPGNVPEWSCRCLS